MLNFLLDQRQSDRSEDDEAAAALAKTDAAAFAELYRCHVQRVYRYVFSYVGEAREAEDLTAQVFTAAWEGIDAYQEQGNFTAWLFRIARNKVSDYYRRRRTLLTLDEAAPDLREDWDPLAALELGENLRRLSRLVCRLDEDQRELLRLRYAAELSYRQIGQVLGRREDAVKMAVHRLLGKLKDQWER